MNMNKIINKTDIFFYIAFFFVCVFILLSSPLAPYAKSSNGVDSSVFIYSAQQILKGQTMYKDIVDHKGPFLYLIDVVALFIFNGKYIGIWIFEIISLFTASIMMYKTARLFSSKIPSFFVVVAALLFLNQLLIGENRTEEWALPFISIAMYIFVTYLKNNKQLNIARLLMLSLSFVLTLMLQANLVAAWAGFGIVVLTKWIIEKKYKELIRSVLFIILFVLLFLSPFFLYFYSKGALSEAIYLIFKYNMFEYQQRPFLSILGRSAGILAGLYYCVSIIPFAIVIYMFLRDKTMINVSVIMAFIFTSLSCSIAGRYEHYYMIFAPLLVIPYSYVFTILKDNFTKAKYVLLFILFVFFIYDPAITHLKDVANNYSEKGLSRSGVLTPQTMEALKNIIIQNTQPEDKILVRGNQASLYLYSGRSCATRFPISIGGSSLAKKYYVKDAEQALPKMILQGWIVNCYSTTGYNLDSLLNEKYQLLPTDIEGAEIWKLKE